MPLRKFLKKSRGPVKSDVSETSCMLGETALEMHCAATEVLEEIARPSKE